MSRIQARRGRVIGLLLSCALAIVAGPRAQEAVQRPIPLTGGMIIDRSVTIRPGTYRLAAAADLKTPALVVRGENLTIDLNGAVLTGGPETADPDSYAGVGVLVDGGRNVTIKPQMFATRLAGPPLRTAAADRLDYISGGSLEDGVPKDRFAIVAEGTAVIPAGDYILRLISDDGARVWVDGELVVDAWEPHESRVDTAPVTGGKRRFKVEYYEVGGFAELRFTIQRK